MLTCPVLPPDLIAVVSKAEITAELIKLSPKDRGEILGKLWHMEEASGPTAREKALLDEAQADTE